MQATVRKPLTEEFPSLPVKPRERINLNAAAAPARPVVSWGAESSVAQNGNGPVVVENPKGKGKKKGKTVLFHIG
jgi:hypothetical protein